MNNTEENIIKPKRGRKSKKELLETLNEYYVTASDSLYCSDKDDSVAELWFKLNEIEPWITLDEEIDYSCPTVEGRSGWCALVDSSTIKPPNGPP